MRNTPYPNDDSFIQLLLAIAMFLRAAMKWDNSQGFNREFENFGVGLAKSFFNKTICMLLTFPFHAFGQIVVALLESSRACTCVEGLC